MADHLTDGIHLTVNGQPQRLTVAPEEPLLHVLRNDLGLHAAKFGCGLGKCGACIVLVDGAPTYACTTPIGNVADTNITTLEGLGAAGGLHPLQQAFIDEQAAQCGYCIPGIIMSAAALLERTPDPSNSDIRTALAGNLCRCGCHPRILRAIRRAATARRTSQ